MQYYIFLHTFVSMREKKPIVWENIKVEKVIVNKLRTHKKKTGISIMAFTKMAIVEKLTQTKNPQ